MLILLSFIALLFIFYLLAKVCDNHFVRSLEIITQRLKISQDVSGATFMAIGSSAPELFTAIIALSRVGIESVGAGTIVGSAIFNILIIIGVCAIVAKVSLQRRPVIRDIAFYLFALLILLFTFFDGVITREETFLYLVLYIAYLVVLRYWKKWFPPQNEPEIRTSADELEEVENGTPSLWKKFDTNVCKVFFFPFPNLKKNENRYRISFVLSIVYIAILSWFMVDIAVFVAHGLGIPEAIIALTILAAGTSVPDLMSSVIAAKKGYGGMAVSNAIGSNTFDILIGLGFPWLVYSLWNKTSVSVGTENLLSSMILLFATVFLLALILIGKKFNISKKEGWILVSIYIGYLIFSVITALNPELFG